MNIDNSLLEKYFKGNCTAEEVRLVEAYLDQQETPEADEWFAQMYEESAATPVVSMKRTWNRKWYGVAATVAILMSFGGWMWHWQQRVTGNRIVALKWDTLANAGNDIKLLSMTDGSEVWLAPHSTVVYNERYNDSTRELWLDGEAYFDVKHDPLRPFSVHTGHLVTTALGTSFNITTRTTAKGIIQVSLLEGRVSVTTATFSCILNPGQMVAYQADINAFEKSRFSSKEVNDWRQGKLVFEKTPLADVFAKLEARKACKIVVSPDVNLNKKVSGTFPASTPVDDILEAMKFVHGFSVEKRGQDMYEITIPAN